MVFVWKEKSSGRYFFAFYIMLTENADDQEIRSIARNTPQMWSLMSMDVNVTFVLTPFSLKTNTYGKKELGEEVLFLCGYEAGPTGFGLYRDLQKAGYSCVIMTPTSLKHSVNHKVKNDKVDARFLAKTLFTKDYSSVHVTTEHEKSKNEYEPKAKQLRI